MSDQVNAATSSTFILSSTTFTGARQRKSQMWATPRQMLQQTKRLPIHAITRRVSDAERYHFPPGTDKAGARLFRKREKKAAKQRLQKMRDTPQPHGFGATLLHNDNPLRTARERAAHFDYNNPQGSEVAELSDRAMFMLSGGKADQLLHLLRARYMEREYERYEGKKVLMADSIPHLYRALVKEIKLCDECYYADEPQPRISDFEYDELITHLLELERCFPELITAESPSQNVGHGASSRAAKLGFDEEISDVPIHSLKSFNATVSTSTKFFKPHRHQALMLSLDNAYNHEDMVSFARRANLAGTDIMAELKIDGVALSLEYKNGSLAIAATRGTGRIGDIITENVVEALDNRGVVLNIPHDDNDDIQIPDYMIVRGEVYMTMEDFKEVNAKLERPLSNPRNAVAGALKHKDKMEAKSRRLQFVAYECLTVKDPDSVEVNQTLNTFASQEKTLLQLERWGFGVMPRSKLCHDFQEAEEFAGEIEKVRSDLPMQIDGLVLKMNDSRIREDAGYTSRAPRGALAFKFASQSRTTELLDVIMQVSRQGVITPVAILNPVSIGGVEIGRATLHNFEHVERLGVGIGDILRIERGGDVIPKVIGLERRCEDESKRQVITPPSRCPSCGGEIDQNDEETRNSVMIYVCKNGMTCGAQTLGRLTHFASRDALNIKGLGRKTAEKLVNSGFIIVMSDLFRLTLTALLSLPGFAEQSAKLLLASIEEAATTSSLERLLIALGLPGVGRIGARSLALKVESLDKLLAIGNDERGADTLQSVPNIAERTATALYEHLQQPQYRSELKAMAELVRPSRIVDEEDTRDVSQVEGSVFEKSFAFTGKFGMMNRPAVMKWVKKSGGRVMSDVSRKTDFLVCGLDPGNKLFKAQRLNICIVQEEEFFRFFQVPQEILDELSITKGKKLAVASAKEKTNNDRTDKS